MSKSAAIVISWLTLFSVVIIMMHYDNNIQESDTVEPTVISCELPPLTNESCKDYIEEMEKWIKSYEASEDRWLTCNLDLTRCHDERNIDIMCIEPNCE